MNGFAEVVGSFLLAGAAVTAAGWFFDGRIGPEEAATEKVRQAFVTFKRSNPELPDDTRDPAAQRQTIARLQDELEDIRQREALLMFQLQMGGTPRPARPQRRTYDAEPEILPPVRGDTPAGSDAIDELYG